MNPRISSLQGLASLPDGDFRGGLRCAIAENPSSVSIVDLQRDGWSTLTQFDSGVAFGAEAELRWSRLDSGVTAVLISDTGATLFGEGEVLVPVDTRYQEVFLWGRWDPNEAVFREDRIPREIAIAPAGDSDALRYPEGTAPPARQRRIAAHLRWYELARIVPQMTESGVSETTVPVRIWRWVGLGEFRREG